MTTSMYPIPTAKVKTMTPQQRASTLFEQGYSATVSSDQGIVITNPKGHRYHVDLETNSCSCRAYSIALHRGNPTCKHIEGAPLLVLRSERHPVTEELAQAARMRGLMFVSELADVPAYFDNGVHQGTVYLYGYSPINQAAIVKRFPNGRTFEISPEHLSIDGVVLEHLQRAVANEVRWKPKSRADELAASLYAPSRAAAIPAAKKQYFSNSERAELATAAARGTNKDLDF